MKSEAAMTHAPPFVVKVKVTVPAVISVADGVQVGLRTNTLGANKPDPLDDHDDADTPVPDLKPANETIEPAHIV